MDGNNLENAQQSKKTYLFVGGYFILFTTLLLIIFLVLNFFNILSLSYMFPKQLSWLPHKPADRINVNPSRRENTAGGSFSLPINPNFRNVYTAVLTYGVVALIDRIEESNNLIYLDFSLPLERVELPRLSIPKNTNIISVGRDPKPGTIADLKKGHVVNLRITYNIKNKSLKIVSIRVRQDYAASGSAAIDPTDN